MIFLKQRKADTKINELTPKIQRRLREFYLSIREDLFHIKIDDRHSLFSNLYFREIFQKFSSYIDDVELYDYYQQAYNINAKQEQLFVAHERLRIEKEDLVPRSIIV